MKPFRFPLTAFLLVAPLFSSPAFAEDNDDDDFDAMLDGLLNDEGESKVASEKRDLLEETSLAQAASEAAIALPEEQSHKRVIKTLQQKNFLKIGRNEVSPFVGAITNDPFIKRRVIGVGFTKHVSEIFGIEGVLAYSHDFGEGDYKAITQQLINENKVSPDISKIVFIGGANFQFSPIYGKVAISNGSIINYDLFASVGTGVVGTKDDLVALQAEDDPAAQATQSQLLSTINFGGGLRVIFNKNLAVKVEAKSLTYIETVNSTTLHYKNNLLLTAGASFFFPSME